MQNGLKSRCWLDGDRDPPSLELRLSDRSYVRVGYDLDYHHRLLWWAPDGETDFVSVTAERTGLDEDTLGPLEAEVESAVRHWDAELSARYPDNGLPPGDEGVC